MKKTYAIIVLSIGMIFSQYLTHAQRICTSSEAHQHLINENVEYKQKRAAIHEHSKGFVAEEGQRVAVTIPVVVHVVWRTGFPSENISDAQILSQIDVLNKDFRRLNTDAASTPAEFSPMAADCEINFCLAQRTPQGTSSTGINRVQSSRTATWGSNDDVKNPSAGGVAAWDPSKYLNIWVCNIGGGVLGYALFPGAPSYLDGVVVESKAFGTVGTAVAPFHLGRTATHEIGHWLDLYHIWGDANCGEDYVADTPLHISSNTGCPAYPKMNACSNKAEMTSNFMDYSNDNCMNIFTIGQKSRMQALFSAGGERASLLNSNGCVPVTQTVVCAAPTGLNTTNITTNSAKLSWTAPTGATAYTFSHRKSGVTTWTQTIVNTNSYIIPNLLPASAYEVKVSTVCGTTTSTAFASTLFTTSTLATCASPTAISVGTTTNNSAQISWTAASGVSFYSYKYKISTETTWITGTTSATSVTLSNLSASTSYNFEIASICTGAVSTAAAKSFTTLANPCTPPTAVTIGTPTTNSVQISWTAAFGIGTYTYKYKPTTTTTWTSVATVSGTSVTISNLSPSTTYDFEVASNCPTTTSTAIAKTFTTSAATSISCGAPISLSANGITLNSANITWSVVAGATSYTVHYKTATATAFSQNSSGTNAMTLSGLLANTPYNVKIVSNCNGVVSTASTLLNFKTSVNVCATSPTGVSISAITGSKARISWSAITGALSYKLQYKKTGTSTWTVVSSIFSPFYDITGLTPSTSYDVQVAVVCSSSITSSFSSIKVFKTTATAACSDVYESNETFSAAKVVNVGTSITANIGKASDKDWFKISNSATAKNIQLTLSNVSSNFNVKLYNSSNQLLATGVSLGTNAKILRWNTLVTGSFYIQISTINGAYNALDCYFLKIETSNTNYGVAARKDESFVPAMEMNVYPNPAQDLTNIQIFSNEEKECDVFLTDITGKIVQKRTIILQKEENLIDLNLENISNGVYFIVLSDTENRIVKRLMIQR